MNDATPTSPPPADVPVDIEDLESDHEQFAGEEIPDPWDDPEQTDWTNAIVEEV